MPEAPAKFVEEKKPSSLLNLLHIALDTYDDIFSDFDPSPYDRRILSDDFIKEMQKRYVETSKGDIEVRFSIPEVRRSTKTEALIKKRLKDYFLKQIKMLDAEIDGMKRNGMIYFFVGFTVLSITIYVANIFPALHTAQTISILLTPIGWFGMWEGVGLFVKAPHKYEEQKKFYVKFSKANYVFMSEEDFLRHISEAEAAEVAKGETKKA